MPSWMQSLESLVRAVSLLSWLGIGFAVLAAFCSAAAFYFNRQVSSRWEGRLQEEVAATTSMVEQEQADRIADLQQELADQRELLLASEERSEAFLDRIEALQQELEQARRQARATRRPQSPPAQPTPSSPPASSATPTRAAEPKPEVDKAPEENLLSNQQVESLRSALQGKPAGPITLVTVVGQPDSAKLASELRAVLVSSGWKVETIQGVFPQVPAESSFVVNSRETIPERASALSVALAMVNLMSLPIRISANPGRPPGFLGMIVAPPRGR